VVPPLRNIQGLREYAKNTNQKERTTISKYHEYTKRCTHYSAELDH
jgi:hypothetical protein